MMRTDTLYILIKALLPFIVSKPDQMTTDSKVYLISGLSAYVLTLIWEFFFLHNLRHQKLSFATCVYAYKPYSLKESYNV